MQDSTYLGFMSKTTLTCLYLLWVRPHFGGKLLTTTKNVQKRVTPFVHVGHNKGLQPLVTAASELLLNVFGYAHVYHHFRDAPICCSFHINHRLM
jgi:hypothetical protein